MRTRRIHGAQAADELVSRIYRLTNASAVLYRDCLFAHPLALLPCCLLFPGKISRLLHRCFPDPDAITDGSPRDQEAAQSLMHRLALTPFGLA
jgi:hypothetical protein